MTDLLSTLLLSPLLQNPLSSIFVPADQLSLTFVFQDGLRRSFGFVNAAGERTLVGVSAIAEHAGRVLTEVTFSPESENSHASLEGRSGDDVLVALQLAGSTTGMIELPE